MTPMTIIVADKDVSDVHVVIPLSLDVTGSVTVEQNDPRPQFRLAFSRV